MHLQPLWRLKIATLQTGKLALQLCYSMYTKINKSLKPQIVSTTGQWVHCLIRFPVYWMFFIDLLITKPCIYVYMNNLQGFHSRWWRVEGQRRECGGKHNGFSFIIYYFVSLCMQVKLYSISRSPSLYVCVFVSVEGVGVYNTLNHIAHNHHNVYLTQRKCTIKADPLEIKG